MIVQLGNKQLRIPEESKSVYLSLGYSVVDEEGKVVESGQATDLAGIKAENTTLKTKLTEIRNENDKLKKANEKLKAENEKLKADK